MPHSHANTHTDAHVHTQYYTQILHNKQLISRLKIHADCQLTDARNYNGSAANLKTTHRATHAHLLCI